MDPGDEEAAGPLAEGTSMSVSDSEDAGVIVEGVQLGAELREARVDRVVSLVARISRVRSALVRLQREIAQDGGIVVVGRDIGTVVLPDADVKLYLEASAEERARRRSLEVHGPEADAGYETVLRDLERRDALDSGRADSPLTPAEDAIVLRTDGMTVDDVVEEVVRIVEAGRWE